MNSERRVKEAFIRMKKHCKECSGKGYTIDVENGTFQDCICVSHFNITKRYIEANIPEEYLAITLDDLYSTFDVDTMKLLVKFIRGLDGITNQYGIYVHPCEEEGTFGVTTCGTMFLRELIDSGRNGFFINMESLIDSFFKEDNVENVQLFEDMKNIDVLLIDGLGNEYYKFRDDNSFVCNKFISFLNTRKVLGKTTVISSDMSISTMNDKYSKTFINNIWRLFVPFMVRCQKQRDRKDGIRVILEKFPEFRERFAIYDGRKYRDK